MDAEPEVDPWRWTRVRVVRCTLRDARSVLPEPVVSGLRTLDTIIRMQEDWLGDWMRDRGRPRVSQRPITTSQTDEPSCTADRESRVRRQDSILRYSTQYSGGDGSWQPREPRALTLAARTPQACSVPRRDQRPP